MDRYGFILKESEDILSIWDSIWVKGIGNGLFEGIWAWIFGGILVGWKMSKNVKKIWLRGWSGGGQKC